MVSKNRIKVMLIYIFLAIYISIRTVNVYAASGNSPVKNTNDGITIVHRAPQEDGLTNPSDEGGYVIKTNEEVVKSHESQQLGNCDGQDYAVGNVTIPSLEINPIVVSNTISWGEEEFETWLRE